MKKTANILCATIFVLLLSYSSAFPQEKLSNVLLNNIVRYSPDRVQFDIRIQRTSERWIKFSNGTFEFSFDTTLFSGYDRNVELERIATSLPQNISAGDILPSNGYITDIFLYPSRMAIAVSGPPSFEDCIFIPRDTAFLIGRYEIRSTDGRDIPAEFFWVEPIEDYQALAYKTAEEITFPEKPYLKYYPGDNVPMLDRRNGQFFVDYSVDDRPPYGYLLEYFDADYVGSREVNLTWKSASEISCRGYTILRYADVGDNPPKDTIATYKENSVFFDPVMISQGTSPNGFFYEGLVDRVEYIGGRYCYELYGNMYSGDNPGDTLLDVDCPTVPALLIADAVPDINPFSVRTTIKYELLDDAYVSVKVYDVAGRELTVLSDDESEQLLDGRAQLEEGFRYVTFKPEETLSTGAYNVVIRAVPVYETNEIEQGYVDVKVQLIK